jgi:hypothetical protein
MEFYSAALPVRGEQGMGTSTLLMTAPAASGGARVANRSHARGPFRIAVAARKMGPTRDTVTGWVRLAAIAPAKDTAERFRYGGDR